MNSKKAKMLRNVARHMSVGKPNINYVIESNGHKKRPSLELEEGCTRKIYKDLKREYLTRLRTVH